LSKRVARLLYEKLKYSNSAFISDAAMNYFRIKRYSFFFEIIESIYQSINKLKTDNQPDRVFIIGKIKKIGVRFAQDVLSFIPAEENVDKKIIRKANLTNKDSYSQISEKEFVLLTNDTKKISTVSLLKSIEKDHTCKLFISPYKINEDDDIFNSNWKITKLTNYTCFEKTIESLKKFTTSKLSSEYLQKIIFSQYEKEKISNSLSYGVNHNSFPYNSCKFNDTNDLNKIAEIKLYDNSYFKVKNQYLNESQKEALTRARSQVLTLIQGPPGTGKTTIGIEIVLEWLRTDPDNRVLVAADSNVAVDILYRELSRAGVKSFRFGNKNFKLNKNMSHGNFIRHLKENRVICTTCVGSTSEYLNELNFKRLLIDEVTQATELATIIPMLKNVKQVVLIGDHKQLSPTVISIDALKQDLGISLFERLVECGIKPVLLNTQYRMHPSISSFPSEHFYMGLVVNGLICSSRPPILGFPWPNMEFRVCFVNIKGVEQTDGNSFYNQQEIKKTIDILVEINKVNTVTLSELGVITPYDSQKKRIASGIKNSGINLNEDCLSTGNSLISIDTVDGFQGADKDLIIFSAVRSNDKGNVGFLKDPRRLNVMLTRAKRGLIVLGLYLFY